MFKNHFFYFRWHLEIWIYGTFHTQSLYNNFIQRLHSISLKNFISFFFIFIESIQLNQIQVVIYGNFQRIIYLFRCNKYTFMKITYVNFWYLVSTRFYLTLWARARKKNAQNLPYSVVNKLNCTIGNLQYKNRLNSSQL